MSGKIKAVVFDSDGTLLDSFAAIVDAYAYVAQHLGRPAPTAEEVRAQLSQAYPLYQILKTFFPGEDMKRMLHLNTKYWELSDSAGQKFEGAEALIATLHAQGIKLAILTGGNSAVRGVYQKHKLDHYFNSFVHCDRVARSKPDPEGFLLATEECGVLPGETVMVGDSPSDLFAGKNGGAACIIGVTHGNGSRQSLEATDPDYLVDSLLELQALLQRIIQA